MSCSTSYRRGVTSDTAWTCQVYSPGAGHIALTRVESQEILVLRETAALSPQQTLPEGAWRIDSDAALRTWWQSGGQALWQSSEGEVLYLQLAVGATGLPAWHVSVDPASGAQMAVWEISAESGQTLQVPVRRDE